MISSLDGEVVQRLPETLDCFKRSSFKQPQLRVLPLDPQPVGPGAGTGSSSATSRLRSDCSRGCSSATPHFQPRVGRPGSGGRGVHRRARAPAPPPVAGLKLTNEADESSTGPAGFMLEDPDGNPVFVDQVSPRFPWHAEAWAEAALPAANPDRVEFHYSCRETRRRSAPQRRPFE